MVLDDTGSVEGIYAFIYCTKCRSGQVLTMPDSLTQWQTLERRANQLPIKYKSGALVTQLHIVLMIKMKERKEWEQLIGLGRNAKTQWWMWWLSLSIFIVIMLIIDQNLNIVIIIVKVLNLTINMMVVIVLTILRLKSCT